MLPVGVCPQSARNVLLGERFRRSPTQCNYWFRSFDNVPACSSGQCPEGRQVYDTLDNHYHSADPGNYMV